MEYFNEVCARHSNIKPTPYKISTITATGDVGAHLHLDVMFQAMTLTASSTLMKKDWGFSSVQFSVDIDTDIGELETTSTVISTGGHKNTLLVRRTALDVDGTPLPMQRSSRRKRRPARHFDNQCTLIYWEKERIDAGVERGVNVKVFRNGRIQMTGIKTILEGGRIVDRLVGTINDIQELRGDIVAGKPLAKSVEYKVCLINSDFNIGFQIRRDLLHNILSRKKTLVCSFEPCIYPGVKLSFMWNHCKTSKNERQNGRCECNKPCKGIGDGYGPGNCRRVTCAIFQSGCTIITGAHSYSQLEDTYRFICEVVSQHKDVLQKSRFENIESKIEIS